MSLLLQLPGAARLRNSGAGNMDRFGDPNHRRQGIRLPDKTVHALIHVIVENQVALGDKYPVKSVLSRLIAEGLNRHEAVLSVQCEWSATLPLLLLKDTFRLRRHPGAIWSNVSVTRFESVFGVIWAASAARSVTFVLRFCVGQRLHCSDNFQFIRPTNQDLCSPSGVFLMVMGGS